MIVDVDIGNTRAKWRLMADGRVLERGVIATREGDWSALAALRSYRPGRVRVSNVAGEEVAQQLQAVVGCSLAVEVEFAQACALVGDVTSGYERPGRLGVDRWLAILAGWDLFHQSCVVVDAGSALTFDFIDAKAAHLGGYIVPGQQMMQRALFGGTSGVQVNALAVPGVDCGQNTDTAVQNGCFAMAVALIEKVVAECADHQGLVNMVLTGGDAEVLLAHLPNGITYKPDLVLDGLALALP